MKLMCLILLLLISTPCMASEDDLKLQLRKSHWIIARELKKVEKLIDSLTEDEKKKLETTYIGDESMTEMDILILGNDMAASGLEKYEFYLQHLPKRK